MTGPGGTLVPGDGVRCMLMRGGTSKGLYFLAGDLPDALATGWNTKFCVALPALQAATFRSQLELMAVVQPASPPPMITARRSRDADRPREAPGRRGAKRGW